MLELRRELLRSHFIFDVWPQSNSYGEHSYNQQQPVHDVIVARFPHQLHDKYGDPSSTDIITKIKNRMKPKDDNPQNTTTKRRKLTADEQWNKEFWYESDIDVMETTDDINTNTVSTNISSTNKATKLALSTSDAFLNYPMPGDNHHNDADSPLSVSSTSKMKWLYGNNRRIKKRVMKERIDTKQLTEELLYRGYVFIFSSGCIVTWGYNGRDRDWIDSFVQLYQNKKGWPSFDAFNLPLRVTIPFYWNDASFLYPNDMKIVRTDFLNLNWIINKKMDVNVNMKFNKKLSNDIEKWNVGHVQQWLTSIGLTNYCDIFEQHEIDGKMLLKFVNSSSSKNSKNQENSSMTNIESNHNFIFIEKILLQASSLKDYTVFIEELNKLNINKEDIFSEDDYLCLPPNTDLNTLIAISYALAQATRLEVLKIAVNYYQKNLMVITEKLAKNGKIWLRKNHWSKLVHHCEMLRDLLFDFGAQPILTQVPHFIEQRSNDCEPIYNAVLDYIDFDEDLNEVSQQIEQLKNRYQSDWEACRDNYGFRLEMIIILFFAIDTFDFWVWIYDEVILTFQKLMVSNNIIGDDNVGEYGNLDYNHIFGLDSDKDESKTVAS